MPPDNNIIAFDPAVCRRLAIRAAGRRAIDGRKRAVARDRLTLGEKIAIIRRGFQLRAGLLKAIDKLWRHDRALIDEHNRTRPDEPAAPDEIAAAAPDLITQ